MISNRMPEQPTIKPTLKVCAIFLGASLCLLFPSCGRSAEPEAPAANQAQLVAVEGLATVELIALLGYPNELTRTRAHLELLRYLVVDTGAAEYSERLTRFHKHAPHACKAEHEAQTLHILGLFAAQQDISSILVKQCLSSRHARVRATALELAHLSDNQIDETLLTFKPDPPTLASYRIALQKLGTRKSAQRLAELVGG